MSTSREPILWIQLLAIGTIPLEALLLKIILAGAPLGALVLLQRIIIAFVAIASPTIVLCKRPADWGSLLFCKLPLKSRSVIQHQISSLQSHPFPSAIFGIGGILGIWGFWSIDESSVLLYGISPFQNLPRFLTLLFSIPILLLIIWQWNQLCQSLWLITRSEERLQKCKFMENKDILKNRFSIGFNTSCLTRLKLNESISSSTIKKS